MGMYTGLRVDVVVKSEWRKAIQLLHDTEERWDAVFQKYPAIPGLGDWVGVERQSFIPFGVLAYMPDDFSEVEGGEGYSDFTYGTGRWQFCCSLKNYEGEIEQFVETVLSRIVESVTCCESLYEERAWGPDGTRDDWRERTTKHLQGSEARLALPSACDNT